MTEDTAVVTEPEAIAEPEFIGGTDGQTTPEPAKAEPEPEAKADQEPEPDPKADPEAEGEEKPKQTPWFQKRIDELTRQRWDTQRENERLAAELAAARQPKQEGEADPSKSAPPPDIEKLANERAAQIAAQNEFNRTCNAVYEDGSKAYTDFDAALSNFQMLGGLPPALVEAAVESGNASRVLYDLGKNPEEAARVMAMNPTRMAMAIAKMAAAPAATPAVSKAPTPIRPIAGAGKVETDPSKMSMEEWDKKFPLQRR